MNLDNFQSQNRGGKGIKGMNVIENDHIDNMFITNTHNYILFFTNKGRVYRMKGYEIPEAGRTARGVNIVNILQLQPEEKISAVIPVEHEDEHSYLMMATRKGIIKKTGFKEYRNIRKSGLIAINLREGDDLIEVKQISDQDDIFLVTKEGQCIRFASQNVTRNRKDSHGGDRSQSR